MSNVKVFVSSGKNKIIYLLGVLVAFVVLDGVVTELLINGGRAREGNPFLEPLVGEVGFMILKVVGSFLCALILWDIHRRFPRVATAATWLFVVAYGVIKIWNASLFLLS